MGLWHQQLADRLETRLKLTGGEAPGLPGADPHPLALPAALARALSLKKDAQRRVRWAYRARDRGRLAQLVGLQGSPVNGGRSGNPGSLGVLKPWRAFRGGRQFVWSPPTRPVTSNNVTCFAGAKRSVEAT
eukprot:834428-Prorocentrum_minimum.AAC.3